VLFYTGVPHRDELCWIICGKRQVRKEDAASDGSRRETAADRVPMAAAESGVDFMARELGNDQSC
jgi:hypothetical protein